MFASVEAVNQPFTDRFEFTLNNILSTFASFMMMEDSFSALGDMVYNS